MFACLLVSPGKSRIVPQFPRNFAKTIHRLKPRWWDYIKIPNLFLDRDLVLLNQQGHLLKQKQSSESWKIAFIIQYSSGNQVRRKLL